MEVACNTCNASPRCFGWRRRCEGRGRLEYVLYKICLNIFVQTRSSPSLTNKYIRSCGFLEGRIGIGKQQITFKYFTHYHHHYFQKPRTSSPIISPDFHTHPWLARYRGGTWAAYGQGECKCKYSPKPVSNSL